MASPIIAWHGDPDLKAATIAVMTAHRRADEIIRGVYWDGSRGCAVGCMTHSDSGGHGQYPARWGIPVELAWLEDTIFEGLPVEAAIGWPERFLAAIAPGADLSRVYRDFEQRLMLDPEHGNIVRCAGFPEVEAAVRQVGELASRPDAADHEWSAAWSAARSAAESAESAESAASAAWSAWSAAESAESAARSAAESAVSAAWSAVRAAWSAVESAAWSAAESAAAHFEWMATQLIEALQNAPIGLGR